MQCNILTAARWKRFLGGSLNREESLEIIEHLSSDCPDCEEFFAAMDDSTELYIRKLLHDGQEGVSVVSHENIEPAFRGIKDENEGAVVKYRWFASPFSNQSYGLSMAGALLLAIFIGGGLVLQNQVELNEPLQTEKGVAVNASSIQLEFAIGYYDKNGKLIVGRGRLGGQYSSGQMVFLQYEIPVDGYVYIVGYSDQNEIELLYPEQSGQALIKEAGVHSVPGQGNVKGWPLTGIKGDYAIIGVYSLQPLDYGSQLKELIRQSVDPATGSIDDQARRRIGQDVAIDAVYFDVTT